MGRYDMKFTVAGVKSMATDYMLDLFQVAFPEGANQQQNQGTVII